MSAHAKKAPAANTAAIRPIFAQPKPGRLALLALRCCVPFLRPENSADMDFFFFRRTMAFPFT
jgi:hypothetical protein